MSGFATREFLEFSRSAEQGAESGVILTSLKGESYPCWITSRANDLFPGGEQFAVSPICLTGCTRFVCAEELHNGEIAKCDISGGFLQTRDMDNSEIGWYESEELYYYVDYRTNYRLPLGWGPEQLLQRMKRDSRQRMRRVLKEEQHFEFRKIPVEDSRRIHAFAKLYMETAHRARFNTSYRFACNDWEHLLQNPEWSLYLLYYNDAPAAGCVVCRCVSGWDYTFMGFNKGLNNSSRAIIFFLYRALSEKSAGCLDLGGGISEEDALAHFKESLGGQKTCFKRVRFLYKSALDKDCSSSRVMTCLKARWP